LSANVPSNPIRVALNIADTELADRLATLLADVPGLRLVGLGETADATVVQSRTALPAADIDVILTPRELEVLVLLAEGDSNKAIARRLGISVHTVKFHIGSLLDKERLAAPMRWHMRRGAASSIFESSTMLNSRHPSFHEGTDYPTDEAPLDAYSRAVSTVVDRIGPAVVRVEGIAPGRRQSGVGSGGDHRR
jgi:hypothetical protein